MVSVLEAVIGLLALIIAALIVIIYNVFIVLRNNISKASADIDVLLKKRHDLIGNLIEVVKGYARYEKTVLVQLTSLRTKWTSVQDKDISDKMAQSNQISSTLKTIFADVENYPDLKADSNFLSLQNTITEIEDQIADRREFYNDSVNAFNIKVQQVPYNLLAQALGYQKMPFLQFSDQDKAPVEASLDTS